MSEARRMYGVTKTPVPRLVPPEWLQRFAKTDTCRALSRLSSAVTSVKSNTRAVATRKRCRR